MRPLELTLRSFRSFGEASVDFRGHRIVVVSGDTGAGKTSLLDGVCFALFGRTPEQSSARELVTLGVDNGEVRFTFSARGGVWRVTRRIGRNAPEPAHLLDQLDDEGAVVDRVSGAAAVNERIPQIIGMSFAAFTSAVLLAQGRFAQFLQANPRERDIILRELFAVTSVDAIRAAAVTLRDAAEREAAVLERERLGLPGHTGAILNALAAAARANMARLAELDALTPLVDAATRERARQQDALSTTTRLRAALVDVPDAEERYAVAEAHRAAEAAAVEAQRVRDDAQRSLDNSIAARDQLRASHGGTAAELSTLRGLAERAAIAGEAIPRDEEAITEREQALSSLRAQRDAREHEAEAARVARDSDRAIADGVAALLAARAVLARAAAAREVATAIRGQAAEAARAATDQAGFADAALDELRHAHLAATIRARLSPGDPCPVCGNAVHDVAVAPEEDLGPVEDGVLTLRERADAAAEALIAADVEHRSQERIHSEALEVVAAAERTLATLGFDGEVSDAAAVALARQADATAAAADAPEQRVVEAVSELEREVGSLSEARRRLEQDRAELAALNQRLGLHSSLPDPATTLAAAARELEMLEQSVESSGRYVAQAASRAADSAAALGAVERDRVAPLRSALAVLATRLGVEAFTHDVPSSQLAVRADELVRRGEQAVQDAEARAGGAGGAADDLEAVIRDRGAPLGVATAEEHPARRHAAIEAVRAARAELAAIERVAVEGRRLARAAGDALREAELYAVLASDLQANRFPRHLLARFHEQLAAGASARLHDLSRGAFTFRGQDPEPMAIVDHRRGRRTRSAATLSGGERFLASLALALALSDIASGSASRLECLFLDEGFSSLDAESLEVAMSGVEQMADDGRLVVVITHLPGVAERLGGAIHVWKDPATGTSRVVTADGSSAAPDSGEEDEASGP